MLSLCWFVQSKTGLKYLSLKKDTPLHLPKKKQKKNSWYSWFSLAQSSRVHVSKYLIIDFNWIIQYAVRADRILLKGFKKYCSDCDFSVKILQENQRSLQINQK